MIFLCISQKTVKGNFHLIGHWFSFLGDTCCPLTALENCQPECFLPDISIIFFYFFSGWWIIDHVGKIFSASVIFLYHRYCVCHVGRIYVSQPRDRVDLVSTYGSNKHYVVIFEAVSTPLG